MVVVINGEAAVSGDDWQNIEAGEFDADLVGLVFGSLESGALGLVVESDRAGDFVGALEKVEEKNAAIGSVARDIDGESDFSDFAHFDTFWRHAEVERFEAGLFEKNGAEVVFGPSFQAVIFEIDGKSVIVPFL